MSYSVDLRKKVERTKNMLEATRVFGINYNTVRKYFKIHEEEGRIKPKG